MKHPTDIKLYVDTSEIDAMVEKTKYLIELLREARELARDMSWCGVELCDLEAKYLEEIGDEKGVKYG